jgi:chloramphenicol-sensitive protein RarD
LLKEQLSRLKFLALGIACVSIVLLARGSARDVTWAITVASFYAGYLVIQRVVRDFDRLNMLAIHLLIAAVMILPVFIYRFTFIPTTADFWINIAFIAVIFTILPLFLTIYSLNGLPSSTLGIIIYTNPIVSFTVAFCYFHEGISVHQMLAYFLLLMAVIVFNWEVIRRSISGWTEKPGDGQPDLKNSY